MDMITVTSNYRWKTKNGGSDTFYTQAVCVPLTSGSAMHPFIVYIYTYSCNDSTLQVLSSML